MEHRGRQRAVAAIRFSSLTPLLSYNTATCTSGPRGPRARESESERIKHQAGWRLTLTWKWKWKWDLEIETRATQATQNRTGSGRPCAVRLFSPCLHTRPVRSFSKLRPSEESIISVALARGTRTSVATRRLCLCRKFCQALTEPRALRVFEPWWWPELLRASNGDAKTRPARHQDLRLRQQQWQPLPQGQ